MKVTAAEVVDGMADMPVAFHRIPIMEQEVEALAILIPLVSQMEV